MAISPPATSEWWQRRNHHVDTRVVRRAVSEVTGPESAEHRARVRHNEDRPDDRDDGRILAG